MAKLGIEFFIARRIGAGGGGGESKGVMVRIAVATTAVSMAVMIVAVSVIMGFRSEISARITAFSGHLRVQAVDYGGSPETPPISLDLVLEKEVAALPGVRSVAPYALRMGLVRTPGATQGVVVKGVGSGYDLSFLRSCLKEGAMPRIGADPANPADSVRHKDIMISTKVADLLRLTPGDRVEILFATGDGRARRDRFRVCGLYSSGFGQMDSRLAVADIANVQRAGGMGPGRVTGYEIVAEDEERLAELGERVEEAVAARPAGDVPLMVREARDDYPQLFDWLKTHDVNAAVIVTIMIAVALIGMISALLIILLERIRMIGILRTLGMRSGPLRRIFVIRAASILLTGLLIGDVAGIGLALLQDRTGLVKLDETGYFLSSVPIALDWWRIAALNVGTFATILLVLVFPTSIISRITPEKTIRYQ